MLDSERFAHPTWLRKTPKLDRTQVRSYSQLNKVSLSGIKYLHNICISSSFG